MSFTRDTTALSHRGVSAMLQAGLAKAEELGVPQNIVIVDSSGVLLGMQRMDGAKYLSIDSATAKARTSASSNNPTGGMAFETSVLMGFATKGAATQLPGGLPIRFGGRLAGGIGVGSGTGEQDLIVARAALASVGADAI